jgi:hypothetical protein
LRLSAKTIIRDEKKTANTRPYTLGLDISGPLCGGTRDATEGATIKGSIPDENTNLAERDNAKLLKNALSIIEIAENYVEGLKCWLDFEAQDFSFSGRYACPTRNSQRRK